MDEVKEILVGVVQKRDKFLIIKRAEHNKYDPGRWEFVSVFVKGSDLEAQAIKQVKHETGLKVSLVKAGKTFEVNDEYGHWLIHPFLFAPINQEVKVDQDHTDYRWVKPTGLHSLDHVRDLSKNLDSFA